MTIFDPARGRIIDGGGSGFGLLRLIGLGIAAFLVVILLFSSVTRVGTGRVGVLTLFGKVQTGETLGEGIHLILGGGVSNNYTDEGHGFTIFIAI